MYNSTTKEPFNTKTITATVITITEMMKGGEEKVGLTYMIHSYTIQFISDRVTSHITDQAFRYSVPLDRLFSSFCIISIVN